MILPLLRLATCIRARFSRLVGSFSRLLRHSQYLANCAIVFDRHPRALENIWRELARIKGQALFVETSLSFHFRHHTDLLHPSSYPDSVTVVPRLPNKSRSNGGSPSLASYCFRALFLLSLFIRPPFLSPGCAVWVRAVCLRRHTSLLYHWCFRHGSSNPFIPSSPTILPLPPDPLCF